MALLEDAVFFSMGVVLLTAAGYFLAFRPSDRRLALLSGYFFLQGLWYFAFLARPTTDPVILVLSLLSEVLLFGFFLLTPTRLPARGWGAVGYALAGVWLVGTIAYLLSGRWAREGPRDGLDALLTPGFLGAIFVYVLLVPLRLHGLRGQRDAATTGLRLVFVALLGRVFVQSGLDGARTALAFAGVGSFPFFLYEPTPLSLTAAFVAYLVGGAGLIAFFEWRYGPTRLSVVLVLAGVVTAVVLLVSSPVVMAVEIARSWSFVAEPAIVLYAQARYGVFGGEPTAVRPTLLVTILSGVFAYLFAFGVVATLLPGEIGAVAAPILALAAAVGVALVVLPRARRNELRRVLRPEGETRAAGGLAPGDMVLGRYRVERLLAEGGQGRVYEAFDRDKARRVVLKALTNDHALSEARMLRGIDHPNVARFVDVVEVTGVTLLVLEYAEGGDLRAFLARRGGRLPVDEALRVAEGLLAGIAAAHAAGVAHRDVKPENVLLDAGGAPKLTDFGAAREAQPGATVRVGGLGTLAYLSPEQAQGSPGDARADVHAAAIVIHELLTGERPIALPDDDFLARRAIARDAPRVNLPPAAAALRPVLERALAKDPDARYQDAGEMLAAMRAARPLAV